MAAYGKGQTYVSVSELGSVSVALPLVRSAKCIHKRPSPFILRRIRLCLHKCVDYLKLDRFMLRWQRR